MGTTKYFIENDKGEWLRDLEHPDNSVSCWTRDPSKAWTFENIGGPSSGMKWLMAHRPGSGSITVTGPDTALDLYRFLYEEGVRDLKITEHEFIHMGVAPATHGDYFRCEVTHDIYIADDEGSIHRLRSSAPLTNISIS